MNKGFYIRLFDIENTGIKYEEMFNCLHQVKRAFNAMGTRPTWIREIQMAIEKMWSKLHDYYSNTERPFAFIDSTLPHPTLKVSFMKKAKYSDDDITNYKREGEQRYHHSYDSSVPVIVPSIPHVKRPRPPSSDSESSDGEDINELTNYLAMK